jgi:hypothetical protein
MPLSFGEIIGRFQSIAEESGCDTRIPYHREALSRINSFLLLMAANRHKELRPDADEDDFIDPYMQVPKAVLFDTLDMLDRITQEEEISTAFLQILSDEERSIFVQFTKFFLSSSMQMEKEAAREAQKSLILSHILPSLYPESIMVPVMEAFLRDGDMIAEMARAIEQNGGNIVEVERPPQIEIFIQRFRALVEQQIGTRGQA